MMIRVKLVIIRISEGNTVSSPISSKICSESDSGRPSPAIYPTARSRPPDRAVWAKAESGLRRVSSKAAANISAIFLAVASIEFALPFIGNQVDGIARNSNQQAPAAEFDDGKLAAGSHR